MHQSFSFVHYSILDWLFFFYVYSFLGWIWESGYASVVSKRPTNRGFLHGPLIPIYGFGALGVLLSTIDVRGSIPLIFLFGMTGATVLELLTGFVMEKLFHVKYWDYSHFPFNFKGYICLFASLGWGVFSVLLIRVIHVPIEDFALGVRPHVLGTGLLFVTALTAVDFYQSVGEALDLRDMLEKLSESRSYIGRLQRRMEIRSVVRIDEFRRELRAAAECHNPFELRRRFMTNLARLRELKRQQLSELLERTEKALPDLPHTAELQKLRGDVLTELQRLGERSDRSYRRVASILGRNPGASSEQYADVLRDLRDLFH